MLWCSDEDAYQPLKDIVVVVVEVKVGESGWFGTKTYSYWNKMLGLNQRWALRKIVRKFRKLRKLRKLRKCAICVAHYVFFLALAHFVLRSITFFQLLRNLRCALCLFFQRFCNLRLRIGKSNICCALIVNFFPIFAITKYFLNVDLNFPVKK